MTNGNLPQTGAKLPPPTALDVSSMQPSEIARHREAISASVEVVLHGYWRDDMPDAMRAAILSDWCDEMEPWPVESVRAALRKHRRENPSVKPNPGHILQILKRAWGERNADQVRAALAARTPPQEPESRVRVDPTRAAEILAQAGFAPKRIEDAE